jgi:hypothetical protein
MLPSATAQLRSLSGKITFAPNMLSSSVLSIYERTADVLGCRSTFAFEDYVSILARIAANVFTTETEIALYIARSMFNHSCDENVVEDGRRGSWSASGPSRLGRSSRSTTTHDCVD